MDGLRFVIYDRTGAYRRKVEGVGGEADISPNVIPTAAFTLDDDHVAIPDVTADGARCGVWFRGEERFRGRIKSTPGGGPDGTVTAHVQGDLRKLWDWEGRPVPEASLSAQTSEYRTYTGPVETVFKTALAENFARLGVPWTVAPSMGRGATVKAEFRFHPLADKLIPLLDAENLTVVLTYTDIGVVVDVREPATVPGVLTIETGIPDQYDFDRVAPQMTRAVIGGRGEGVAREFAEVVDSDLEADWGDIIEGFVDARNTDPGADLTIEGRQKLAENGPTASVSCELVETDRFLYGTTYQVGDLVHVRLGPVDRTQRVSVSITDNARGGVLVTPRIGDVKETTEVQLAKQIARLARGIRDSGRR